MPLSVCSACRLPSRSVVAHLPCDECLSSLLRSPAICAECLGFACPPGACARPWLAVRGEDDAHRFDSVAAGYLSLGPGARVLKSWKTAPSPALTRFLAAAVRASFPIAPERPAFLIPVPQSEARRWKLAGGSALRLCRMIREERRNPGDRVLDLLELGTSNAVSETAHTTTNQGRTRGDARYSRSAGIRARPITEAGATLLKAADFAAIPELLLVDDFLTSGATLRAAARAAREKLGELGWFGGRRARLGVYVLGFRPALFGSSSA